MGGFVSDIGPHHTITLNAQCELFELHVERGGQASLELAQGLAETLRLLHRQTLGASDTTQPAHSNDIAASSTTSAAGPGLSGSDGNMYVAYCESALGLLKHKQAIAIEQKQKQQLQKEEQGHSCGCGQVAESSNALAADATAALQLREEAQALYRSALNTQVALHGTNHAYAAKTARRLESLCNGGNQVYCPHSLAQPAQSRQAART